MLVRRVLSSVGEGLSLDQNTLDDMKLGASAACNNVVVHAYGGRYGPLGVTVHAGPEWIEVTVRDHGCGIRQVPPAIEHTRFGLAVIGAVSQRAEFRSPHDGGTNVRMQFRAGAGRSAPLPAPASPSEIDQSAHSPFAQSPFALSGDAVVTLAPVTLLGSLLGRLSATLVKLRRFSVDRAGEVEEVMGALADHALKSASGGRISFALLANDGRFEVKLAPLRSGSSGELQRASSRRQSALRTFNDEIAVDATNEHESIHVVLLPRG